jgi:hypothetical protein
MVTWFCITGVHNRNRTDVAVADMKRERQHRQRVQLRNKRITLTPYLRAKPEYRNCLRSNLFVPPW